MNIGGIPLNGKYGRMSRIKNKIRKIWEKVKKEIIAFPRITRWS